jgi:hypothetical protein
MHFTRSSTSSPHVGSPKGVVTEAKSDFVESIAQGSADAETVAASTVAASTGLRLLRLRLLLLR